MRVRLQKTHRERHLMEVLRDDGTAIRREVETRSTLRHDLMHWVYEHAAGLRDSFWGRLARGEDPDQDRNAMAAAAPVAGPLEELHATEILVGMLQGAAAREVDPAVFVARARSLAQGQPLPPFLTPDFVRSVFARWRQLVRQWESLRHGGVLELQGFATASENGPGRG